MPKISLSDWNLTNIKRWYIENLKIIVYLGYFHDNFWVVDINYFLFFTFYSISNELLQVISIASANYWWAFVSSYQPIKYPVAGVGLQMTKQRWGCALAVSEANKMDAVDEISILNVDSFVWIGLYLSPWGLVKAHGPGCKWWWRDVWLQQFGFFVMLSRPTSGQRSRDLLQVWHAKPFRSIF